MDAEKRKIDPVDLLILLNAGSKRYQCGKYLYHLNPLYRQQIYQDLETERLRDKYLKLRELYNYTNQDWNQVFLVWFLRYLSDKRNRDNYMELGLKINYNTILRERSSLRNLEALLVATSGLIDTLPRDSFTTQFRKDVEYMTHKYQIRPIPKESWDRRGMTPSKEPIIRLLQVANLLYNNDIIFNKLISCRTRDDIFGLFNVNASPEWMRYFGGSQERRIGVEKCDLVGINFVVPMLYAFGHYTSNQEMCDVARELNETLPAESNTIITGWKKQGLTPIVAYETQALIQLYTVYCKATRCEECPLYRHMLSKSSILDQIPIFTEYQR